MEGRWPGPPGTTTAPADSNSAVSPGPAAPAAVAAFGDLLGEVGDPDPVGAPGGDARLDRGTDVIDVHVHVPEAVTADDHEAVAQWGELLAQHSDRFVLQLGGDVEEVHHLVARTVLGEVLAGDRD